MEHDYTGDPKHCHACALRAFVNAELRTRAADNKIATLRSALRELVESARPAFPRTLFRRAIDKANAVLVELEAGNAQG